MGVDIEGKRIAVLGAGKMGGILLKALLDKGLLRPELACATVAHEERARSLSEKLALPWARTTLPLFAMRTSFSLA